MFDVDGTPLYTLDFSDFHECDERRIYTIKRRTYMV